jgi:hypothetical protein
MDTYTKEHWHLDSTKTRDQIMCTKLFQLYIHEPENSEVQKGAKSNFKQRCMKDDEIKFQQIIKFYKVKAQKISCDNMALFNFYPLKNLSAENKHFRDTVDQFLKTLEHQPRKNTNFESFWSNNKEFHNLEQKVGYLRRLVRQHCFSAEIINEEDKEFRTRVLYQIKFLYCEVMGSEEILTAMKDLKMPVLSSISQKMTNDEFEEKKQIYHRSEFNTIRKNKITMTHRSKNDGREINITIKHKFTDKNHKSNYRQDAFLFSFIYPGNDRPNIDIILESTKFQQHYEYLAFFNPHRENMLSEFSENNNLDTMEFDFESANIFIGKYIQKNWCARLNKKFNTHHIVNLLYRNIPKVNLDHLKELNKEYIKKLNYKGKDPDYNKKNNERNPKRKKKDFE